MKLQDIHPGTRYLVRVGRFIRIVTCGGQISGQLAWLGRDDLGIDRRFMLEGIVGEFVKPKITLEGMKPGNVWHLFNRVKKTLADTGVDLGDLKDRLTNRNAPMSFKDAIVACLEYVEITHEPV